MPNSNFYQETWDSLTWKERGRFLVNCCESIPSSEYLAISRLNWTELPRIYQEKITFEIFVLGTISMAMDQ